jgi:hypothetical protein
LIEITPTINKLKNLPFSLGKIEIVYQNRKKVKKIMIEVIKVSEGWRILENPRSACICNTAEINY